MTWTNAFDLGPCTVHAYQNWGLSIFSGILAKGETSAEFSDDSAASYTVTITASGAAQLNRLSATVGASGLRLTVVPNYDTSLASAARVSGIVLPNGISGVAGAFTAAATPDVVLSSADAGATWTPDPAESSTAHAIAGLDVWEAAIA